MNCHNINIYGSPVSRKVLESWFSPNTSLGEDRREKEEKKDANEKKKKWGNRSCFTYPLRCTYPIRIDTWRSPSSSEGRTECAPYTCDTQREQTRNLCKQPMAIVRSRGTRQIKKARYISYFRASRSQQVCWQHWSHFKAASIKYIFTVFVVISRTGPNSLLVRAKRSLGI